ncbi:MAG: GatB/YqeY domain-containing protein [Caldiserica bacterium]|nr:GatB/YqeY domain-containing protein [Caldisericota bacterium]
MIFEKISKDYIQAMKARDSLRIGVLSYIKSVIKYREIENREKEKKLTDDDVVDVISKEVRKREESIEMYKNGEREDLAHKEEEELKVLKEYLPAQMREEEIRKTVVQIIEKLGATGSKDFRKVMKEVMIEIKGKANGALIKKIVEESLES